MSNLKISPFVLILTVFSVFAQADDSPVSGPRFDDAKYVVKAFTSEGSERTVIIKRTGPYFSTFIKQKYDYSNSFATLAQG